MLEPAQPQVLYELSLAYAMAQKIGPARDAAVRLSRMAPTYPTLPGLLKALQLTP
jgi:hypothetical protein